MGRIETGIKAIDNSLVNGLTKEKITIIQGPTAGGKTMSLLNVALNLSVEGKNVLFLSQEMTAFALQKQIARVISGSWDIDRDKVKNYIEDNKNIGDITVKNVSFSDNLNEIRDSINRYVEFKKIDVVLIDFLPTLDKDDAFYNPRKYVEYLIDFNRSIDIPIILTKNVLRDERNGRFVTNFETKNIRFDYFNIFTLHGLSQEDEIKTYDILFNDEVIEETISFNLKTLNIK
jgi:KaiC/GvpD/RAD55 family RecA-like ATPase